MTERLNNNNAVFRGFRRFLDLKGNLQMFPFLISGGLGLQRLGPGLGFPARDWAGSQQCKHQVRATRPVVSDTGPGPSALQKRIPTEMESSEASKVFSGRKREQCM